MVKLKFQLRLKSLKKPKSRTRYDFKQSEQNHQCRLELSNKFQKRTPNNYGSDSRCRYSTPQEKRWVWNAHNPNRHGSLPRHSLSSRRSATALGSLISTDAVLPEEYEDLIHKTCHEWNGSETSGPEQETMVKTRKLKYFGHISRHASLESDIMLGTMPGLRRQGGQRKQWMDDLR